MSKRDETTRPSDTDAREGDAFLTRWARRKRVARAGGDPDADDAQAPAAAGPAHAEAEEQSGDVPRADGADAPDALTDADMPPVDSIDESTDMSGFFSPGVSQALRKAALRKFFHSQTFNLVDGLDDYDEDFRTFEALGDMITSDMRGRMQHEAERAEQSPAEDGDGARPAHAEPASEPAGQPDPAAQGAPAVSEAKPDAFQETDHSLEPEGTITRDPSRVAGRTSGKLRPRTRRDDDSEQDDVGEGEDA